MPQNDLFNRKLIHSFFKCSVVTRHISTIPVLYLYFYYLYTIQNRLPLTKFGIQ